VDDLQNYFQKDPSKLEEFADWYWPDDFTDADKDAFVRGVDGDQAYECLAAYNRAAAFNLGSSQGKDGMTSTDAFASQAEMYKQIDD
jgi:hypothetical protein